MAEYAAAVAAAPAVAKSLLDVRKIVQGGIGDAVFTGSHGDPSYVWGKRIQGEMVALDDNFKRDWCMAGHSNTWNVNCGPDEAINFIHVESHWKDGTNGVCHVTKYPNSGGQTTSCTIKIDGISMRGVSWSVTVCKVKFQ
jgi:hypothetical protein